MDVRVETVSLTAFYKIGVVLHTVVLLQSYIYMGAHIFFISEQQPVLERFCLPYIHEMRSMFNPGAHASGGHFNGGIFFTKIFILVVSMDIIRCEKLKMV